jgi:hypothetical protein
MFDRFDDRTLEIATVIVVVIIALVILCYLAIYINPQVIFNPFRPDTPTPVAVITDVLGPTWTPSPTPTETGTPRPTATWTPSPTPTATATPTPTWTPTATPTDTPPPTLPPTATRKPAPPRPTATPTPWPYYPSGPTADGPAGVRPDCERTWVLGYVFDANGLSEPNVQVRLGNNDGWTTDVWTDINGRYMYEFWGAPLAGYFYAQVYKGGAPRSIQYGWYTSAGCEGPGAAQYMELWWRHR